MPAEQASVASTSESDDGISDDEKDKVLNCCVEYWYGYRVFWCESFSSTYSWVTENGTRGNGVELIVTSFSGS